jgi:CBS domain-containing protein
MARRVIPASLTQGPKLNRSADAPPRQSRAAGVECVRERALMKSIKAIVADRETVVVDRLTSVIGAVQLMSERQIGAVPVLDGTRLVGIFTERDLMARVVAADRDPKVTTVGDVMSTDLVAGDLAESYETCLIRMQQAHVRHLIVLEDGRLAGIVSLRDLMAADLDDKDEAITLLNAYVHYIPADLSAKAKT